MFDFTLATVERSIHNLKKKPQFDIYDQFTHLHFILRSNRILITIESNGLSCVSPPLNLRRSKPLYFILKFFLNSLFEKGLQYLCSQNLESLALKSNNDTNILIINLNNITKLEATQCINTRRFLSTKLQIIWANLQLVHCQITMNRIIFENFQGLT